VGHSRHGGDVFYLANPCNAEVVSHMAAGTFGFIGTPAQWNRRPQGVPWCADNGAFSNRWDEGKWWAYLVRHAKDADTCLFATAPDVVGDAKATLERSAPWYARIRELGYPVALVAQDGLEDLVTPWDDIDALFIGGTTDWKLGPHARRLAAEAKARGKWVHCGRVNSKRRFDYCATPVALGGMGCDSADGTFLTYGPDKNLPQLLHWIADSAATLPL
jgi:hypothetical protein